MWCGKMAAHHAFETAEKFLKPEETLTLVPVTSEVPNTKIEGYDVQVVVPENNFVGLIEDPDFVPGRSMLEILQQKNTKP